MTASVIPHEATCDPKLGTLGQFPKPQVKSHNQKAKECWPRMRSCETVYPTGVGGLAGFGVLEVGVKSLATGRLGYEAHFVSPLTKPSLLLLSELVAKSSDSPSKSTLLLGLCLQGLGFKQDLNQKG